MRAIGIDIGTTTISAVVAESGSRRVEQSFTIINGSFIETENPWEKLQDPAVILRKSEELLEDILETYPDIGVIGLTGQMHGVVYTDREGRHVSPLYTWQDGRGNIPCRDGRSVSALLTAIYMVGIVVRAFFPGRDFDYRTVEGVREPGWKMLVPLAVLAALTLCFGLHSGPVVRVLEECVRGFRY